MADAFDVSLRVRLDYQAAAPARTAATDLNAIATAARRITADAKTTAAGLSVLADAEKRLSGTVGAGAAIAKDLDKVGEGAKRNADRMAELDAKLAGFRSRQAARAATSYDWGDQAGKNRDWAAYWRDKAAGKPADARMRAADWVAAGAPDRTAAVAAMRAEAAARTPSPVRRAAVAAAPVAGSVPAVPFGRATAADRLGRRDVLGIATVSPAEATFRRLADAGRRARRDVLDLGAASGKLGEAGGPGALAGGLDAVAGSARAARRSIDDAGRAAVRAGRDAAGMGAAGGGAGGHGGGDDGAAAAPHAGPGGMRGALVAAARPLHMERMLMSATTPMGLMGLGAGLGVVEVEQQIEKATKQAIELEDAMNEIRRTSGTMSAEGVRNLEGEILRTSRATGAAAVELAHLGAEATAAGRPAADLPRFMDLSARAATAFRVKVDELGPRLTRIGTDFALDQEGLQRVADATALLQERTGARGGATLDVVAGAGGAAHLAGMAPEQVAAFGAGMGKLGIADPAALFTGLLDKLTTAPMQGGSFKQGLTHVAGPDGHTPEGPYELRDAMLANPSAGMLRFLDDVRRLPEARRQFVLGQMFSPQEADNISRMSDHLEDFTKNLATVQNTSARNGAVERVFSVFDDATSKKIEHATAAIGAFATKMGQNFAPAVGAAAEATSRFFGGWFDRLDRMEKASELAGKIARNVALSPEETAKLAADPQLKATTDAQLGAIRTARARDAEASPDPEAGRAREMTRMGAAPADAEARGERDRLKLVEAIRENTLYARAHGGVGADEAANLRAAYDAQYPDKPLPAFSGGGRVMGPGGPREDRVVARLSPGEFVINAEAHARHPALVRAINDNTLPAYADGGAVGALAAGAAGARPDPSAQARLEDTISKGVKEGVVSGLREARDMPGAAAGAAALGAGSEADGAAGGAGEGSRPNLRFGRAAGVPNMRYGRAAGGGYRGTPSARSHGAFRPTPSGHHGGGAGASAYGHAGGWTIGAGDGTATTQDSGPGFTSGMKARNLGNIGYFGQHEAGLVGPSNSHDVDHSIALYASQEDGIRAAARLALRKYQSGMRNTATLIAAKKGGWTPGALGPGASVNIAKSMGLSNQDDLHLDDPGQMRKFLHGLAVQEHGSAGNFYTPEMIDRALKGGGPAPAASANAEREVPASASRKGFANLMHGQYGAPGQNLTTVTTPGGRKVTVHREAAASFQGFLGDLEKSGYNINSLGGYANRGMAGNPNRISQHAYGNAIDINPAQNPFHTSQTDLPRNVSDMAAKWGLSWGGDWSERSRDPMHFEWTGARPWEHQAGPAATAANKPNVMPFGLTGTALAAMDRARAARAASIGEDRASRSTAVERRAAVEARPTLSARFTDPGLRQVYEGSGAKVADARGARPGAGPGHPPSVVQNFYGQHDPRETAEHARRASNREIKRAQARALHGVGRPA